MDNKNSKVILEKKQNTDGTDNKRLEAHYYSAPLPPPQMMAEYNKVVSGSADRIIKRFESQGEHRQKCEIVLVWTQSIKAIAGVVAGFVIAMTAIVGGIYTALQGKVFLGGSLSFTALAILVGAFITDKFFIKADITGNDKKN